MLGSWILARCIILSNLQTLYGIMGKGPIYLLHREDMDPYRFLLFIVLWRFISIFHFGWVHIFIMLFLLESLMMFFHWFMIITYLLHAHLSIPMVNLACMYRQALATKGFMDLKIFAKSRLIEVFTFFLWNNCF